MTHTWTPRLAIPCTYGGKAGTWYQNSPTNVVPDPGYGTFHHATDPGFGPMSYPNIARAQIVETAS